MIMEKRIHRRTDSAKRRVSPEANEVSMKISNRSQLSTQDQQNRVCRLIQWLKNSPLGCWLSETCAGTVAFQLLTACLFLLFVGLLVEPHVALPCLFLCDCFFHGPIRRAVDTIWEWITAPVGYKVEEKVPHTDGYTEIK